MLSKKREPECTTSARNAVGNEKREAKYARLEAELILGTGVDSVLKDEADSEAIWKAKLFEREREILSQFHGVLLPIVSSGADEDAERYSFYIDAEKLIGENPRLVSLVGLVPIGRGKIGLAFKRDMVESLRQSEKEEDEELRNSASALFKTTIEYYNKKLLDVIFYLFKGADEQARKSKEKANRLSNFANELFGLINS